MHLKHRNAVRQTLRLPLSLAFLAPRKYLSVAAVLRHTTYVLVTIFIIVKFAPKHERSTTLLTQTSSSLPRHVINFHSQNGHPDHTLSLEALARKKEKRLEALILLRYALRLVADQLRRGGRIVFEHPISC